MSQSSSSPKIKQEEEEEEIGLEQEEGNESKSNPQLGRQSCKKGWNDEANRVLIECMIKLDFHTQHISRGKKMTFAALHKDFISKPEVTQFAESQIDSEFSKRYTNLHYIRNKYYTLRKVFQDIMKKIIDENLRPPYTHLHRYFNELNKVFGSDTRLPYPRKRTTRKRTSRLIFTSSASPTPTPVMATQPSPSPIMTANPLPTTTTTTITMPPPAVTAPPTEPVGTVLNSILTELQTFNTNFLYSVAATNKTREKIAAKDRKSRKKIATKDRKSREKIAALDREARFE